MKNDNYSFNEQSKIHSSFFILLFFILHLAKRSFFILFTYASFCIKSLDYSKKMHTFAALLKNGAQGCAFCLVRNRTTKGRLLTSEVSTAELNEKIFVMDLERILNSGKLLHDNDTF